MTKKGNVFNALSRFKKGANRRGAAEYFVPGINSSISAYSVFF
jgi:hypothetical protein